MNIMENQVPQAHPLADFLFCVETRFQAVNFLDIHQDNCYGPSHSRLFRHLCRLLINFPFSNHFATKYKKSPGKTKAFNRNAGDTIIQLEQTVLQTHIIMTSQPVF